MLDTERPLRLGRACTRSPLVQWKNSSAALMHADSSDPSRSSEHDRREDLRPMLSTSQGRRPHASRALSIRSNRFTLKETSFAVPAAFAPSFASIL